MFVMSILLFAVTVPLLVLYAIGYRLDLESDTQNFRTVGGMYVSTGSELAEIYVDDEVVEDMRLFQQAAYIQNITAGMVRVHTQGDGIETWVKELPVYSHLVTQAQSFNMPSQSTVRYVSPYVNDAGVPLYREARVTERPFVQATTSIPIIFATTSVATLGSENPEYTYLETLFASTTEERAILIERESYEAPDFSFEAPRVFATTTATTTIVDGNYTLQKEQGEVYVSWTGSLENIPHYYCVFTESYIATKEYYGEHVADQLFTLSTTTATYEQASTTVNQNSQLCRTKIKLDRKWQVVIWLEFLPGSNDHVLLQLQDGIYVVEVDDRAWQNVQQLYAGDYLTMIVDGEQIFVKDGDIIFEVLLDPLVVSN